jgi:hypothetical protein
MLIFSEKLSWSLGVLGGVGGLSPLSEINSHGRIFMVPHCGISPLGEKE